MDKKIILVIILLLASSCYAETSTLVYTLEDDSMSGIDFFTGELASEKDAELFFTGVEDKLEGMEKPFLYTTSKAKIVKDCEASNGYVEAVEVNIGAEHCIYSGEEKISLVIISLSNDWSSVTFDWKENSPEPREQRTDMLYFQIVFFVILMSVFLYLVRSLLVKK